MKATINTAPKAFLFISIILFSFFFAGCDNATEIDRAALMKKTKIYKEPKVAIWYYQGSDDIYDYFLYRDLGIEEQYKVKRSEEAIPDKIRFTPPLKDDHKLIIMP